MTKTEKSHESSTTGRHLSKMMSLFSHELRKGDLAVGDPVDSVSFSPSADLIGSGSKCQTTCMAVKKYLTIQTSMILHQRALRDEGMIKA